MTATKSTKPVKKAVKKAPAKKAAPRARTKKKAEPEAPAPPPPLTKGQRVQYARRPAPGAADPRLRLGFATVEYEWLALDERAVRVRLDNGRVANLFPGFGDRVTVVT